MAPDQLRIRKVKNVSEVSGSSIHQSAPCPSTSLHPGRPPKSGSNMIIYDIYIMWLRKVQWNMKLIALTSLKLVTKSTGSLDVNGPRQPTELFRYFPSRLERGTGTEYSLVLCCNTVVMFWSSFISASSLQSQKLASARQLIVKWCWTCTPVLCNYHKWLATHQVPLWSQGAWVLPKNCLPIRL